MKIISLIFSAAILATQALAEEPRILGVGASQDDMGWRFDVTIAHGDTGWDHYADGWEILDENGRQLGFRKLLHPHENEQPFTRSISHIMVPDGATSVYVRAKCSVIGWAGAKTEIKLTH